MTLIPCPLYMLTGYDCTFCGGQRMFIALLHGNVTGAFWLNPVLFCLLPYFLLLMIGAFSQKARTWKVVRICYSNKTIFAVMVIFAVWGVVRNIIDFNQFALQ